MVANTLSLSTEWATLASPASWPIPATIYSRDTDQSLVQLPGDVGWTADVESSVDQYFFALGGNSMQAFMLQRRIK